MVENSTVSENRRLSLVYNPGKSKIDQHIILFIQNYSFSAERIVENRWTSLHFDSTNEQGQKVISHLQQYENKDIIEILEAKPDWKEWIFETDLSGGGRIKINVLHYAIIMKNKQIVDHILEKKDIKDFVKKRVKESSKSSRQTDGLKDDDWIYGATSLHLAARFFHDCMFKLIEVDKDLVNNQENELRFSPMHITAMSEFQIGTR